MIAAIHCETGPFFTPEQFAYEQRQRMVPGRGTLVVAACSSGAEFFAEVARAYREFLEKAGSGGDMVALGTIENEFSDGETRVRIDHHVGGADVFLIQSLANPAGNRSIDENYLSFLIAARAFRENGAKHITGILPYLAYGRQDKPTRLMREPTTAKLMADLSVAAGIDRIVTWHPHSKQIQGFYAPTPVTMLEPVVYFADELARFRGREDCILVAPDEGASKVVTHVAHSLDIDSAITAKFRARAEQVNKSEVIGDFSRKKIVVLIDDIISSGETIYSAVKEIRERADIGELYLCASHHLCLPRAKQLFSDLAEHGNLKGITVTNSIPQTDAFSAMPLFTIRSLSAIMARVINRIHYSRSVSEVFRPAR